MSKQEKISGFIVDKITISPAHFERDIFQEGIMILDERISIYRSILSKTEELHPFVKTYHDVVIKMLDAYFADEALILKKSDWQTLEEGKRFFLNALTTHLSVSHIEATDMLDRLHMNKTGFFNPKFEENNAFSISNISEFQQVVYASAVEFSKDIMKYLIKPAIKRELCGKASKAIDERSR